MTPLRAGIVHQPQGQTGITCLPLEEVSVKAWVVDAYLPVPRTPIAIRLVTVSSRIHLAQTFYNPSDEPTGKAKYVFPVPASAAVCAFELEMEDGSVIIGKVKEKEEAAHMFTQAVEQGRTTALVERVTDDIFTISIGSIPATTRVTAYLTFVMDLLDEGVRDHIRLQLPMYIAERYGTPPTATHDTSAANAETRLRINVDIQTSDVIYAVRSPTHPIALRYYKGRSGRKSQRRMSAVWKSSQFLTDDFVITIHAEGLDEPRCFAEALDVRGHGNREGSTIAMQLTLVPKFLAPKVPSQDYIFIIDRSGSMTDEPIETAKRTLTMLLRLLPSSGTTFNVFSFGSIVTSLWSNGSCVLDQASLAKATSHVEDMSADYGGTDIPKALQSALDSRGLSRPTVVFLLTDGQIQRDDQLDPFVVISNAIRDSPPQAPVRLFVLGIGTGVSSDVCSSLARAGNGEYLYALSAENISGKCARLLNAGRSKNIEQINIDWGYNASNSRAPVSSVAIPNFPASLPALAPPRSVQQAPHSLTRIFSGIRFTVFAIASFRTPPTSVRLIIRLDGVPEPQELSVEVTKVKPFRDTHEHSMVPIVHTLAARKLIMELDEGAGPLPSPASGDALLVTVDDLRKAGIVRLGLTYQLVSKHTSFIAVQEGDGWRRSRGRGSSSGNKAWIKSRLRQTGLDTHGDTSAEAPTFLDSLIDTVSSFIASVFGYGGGPAMSATTSNPTTHSRPRPHASFPGAYAGSDPDANEDSRGRRRKRASSPTRSVASRSSIDTLSTLSSIGDSSCSSCWTSRPPSPLPFRDLIERAPSPDICLDESSRIPGGIYAPPNPNAAVPRRLPISQEVYNLFMESAVDGSFTASPLLTQLVGDTVLNKADELGIDKTVWATVVAVAYMKIRLQDEPDMLELLLEKAKEFVEVRIVARRFDDLVREAGTLLAP